MVRRSEFLKANAGTRVPMPAFVLLVRPRGDDLRDAGFGITATKKLGGAVIRNRAKRRFRAIIRESFPAHALAGADHVLIARADALTQGHASLTADVVKALAKARQRMGDASAPLPLAGGAGGAPAAGQRQFAPTPDPSRKRGEDCQP